MRADMLVDCMEDFISTAIMPLFSAKEEEERVSPVLVVMVIFIYFVDWK